jgi:GTP cyclohydrolase I
MREQLRPDLSYASNEDIIREYVRRASFGREDVNREGLRDTGVRVERSWRDLLIGYTVPAAERDQWLSDLLFQFPEEGWDEMVVVKDIPLFSFCEHHLLPFTGTAAVGYVPSGGKVTGLSKLARLVQFWMGFFTTQERICHQVASSLMKYLPGCKGAGCVVRATHLCMCARGASVPGAATVTSSLHGVLRDQPATRAEFLNLAGG